MGILQIYLAWYSLSSAVNGEKTILQSKLMIFCGDKKLWDKSLKSVTGGRDREVNHQGQHIPSLSPFHGAGSKAWTGMRRRREKLSELYILRAFPSPVSPPPRFGACIGNVYKFKIFVFNKGPAFTFWNRPYILVEHLKRKLPLFKLRNFSNPTEVSNSKRRHRVLYVTPMHTTLHLPIGHPLLVIISSVWQCVCFVCRGLKRRIITAAWTAGLTPLAPVAPLQ